MPKIVRPFASQLRTIDLLTADVTLGATDAWTQIGSYLVPDGTAIRLGVGALMGQDNAEGRLYADIVDDAAGAEDGQLRIEARNPNQTQTIILYEFSTIKGRSGTADDRGSQIPFPSRGNWIPENWTIRLFMLPDAAGDVVDVSACTVLIDIERADFLP